MKTLVVNLYGGPGTGKSTSAAQLFALLKVAGVNAELVTEYAKGWAWEGRKIHALDQFYLLGKQIRRESCLYGKVDMIVTDSPIAQCAVYAARYCSPAVAFAVDTAVRTVRAESLAEYFDVQLVRSKPYNPAGRYETEDQAREIDRRIANYLDSITTSLYIYSTNAIDDLAEVMLRTLRYRQGEQA